MFNTVVAIAAISQVVLGLFVYLKRRDSSTNIAFAFVSLATLSWALANYVYTLNPVSGSSLFITRLILFFVVIQNTVFYIFAINYPSHTQRISHKRLTIVIVLSALVAAATMSPFVFKSVTIEGGQSNPNPGPMIAVFMLHAVYTIGSGLASLVRKIKHSTGQIKQQLKFIFLASVLNWVIVPITNFAITLILQTSFFARVSPLYSLLFSGIIAYAIITQKLFDIRAAVARSVAYVLSLSSIGVVYGGLLYVISSVLSSTQIYDEYQRLFYVGLAIFSSLFYQRFITFFNRATNKIFYQDAYDSSVLLDELNHTIVGNVYLQSLLRQCGEIIAQTLKTEFCTFIIFRTADQPARVIGPTENTFPEKYTESLLGSKQLATQHMVVHDDMLAHHPEAAKLMATHNIALICQIGARDEAHSPIGLLALGQKMSGNPIAAQDRKVIEIITNELTIAIQNVMRFEEIQGFNVTLQAKVNEATHELEKANNKLIALNDTKDDFISMASHQLRTPLTAVKGNISMIMDGDFGKVPKTVKDPLNQAYASSERMVGLIADLLNVSRLRTGKFAIQPVPSNLHTVVKSELKQLQETAKAHKLTLTYDAPEEFPTLMLDEIKIRQVIMNFIDNAIYYTPAGGHISVALKHTAHSIEFTVSDDGIGVPRHLQKNLFTKFYRADNAQKMRPDGTGIGLFMAKKVIIASGGSVIFKSTEGKGSTFGFTIPLAKLAPTSVASAESTSVEAQPQ